MGGISFENSLQTLQDLMMVSEQKSLNRFDLGTNLELDLGLGDILLAAAAIRNLLCLRDLCLDSLRAEIFQG